MGTSGNEQGGFNFMALGSMKKAVTQIWDAPPTPDTAIARLNALDQGQTNDLGFLDRKKRPIGELDITGVYYGETEDPQIEMIEPDTNINTISAGA